MFDFRGGEKITVAGAYKLPDISDYRHIVFSIHADASTTATIRVKGSAMKAVPDFGSASSASNDWGYIAFRELETADLKAGSTGVSITTTTIHKVYEVECNALTHAAIDVSSISGDGVTVHILLKED